MSGWSLPTGRKLEQPGYDPNYVGTVGPLRPANEASLRLARKRLREIHGLRADAKGGRQ
jgi:hypothetical protein